ncbi:SCO family protein [Aestuariivirga sp.]|uniref:SCO family protein n=1 Tax=Aestuariivirga sp. TaxID=2650926 RepID=UPI0025BACD92|nr:SCO family protein [Aestuariivirga sp.]MCA3554772.1 SCO family protein [Aestuariivirga sp.]
MKLKNKRAILIAAVASILVAGAAAWFADDLLRGPNQSSVFEIGGPFVLASSRGGVVDSKKLAGKPYAVFFGFTHCPEVCPTTLYEMSNSLAALGDVAKDFRVFFITVDPERDTLEAMKDYVANFDPRIEALVPTEDQLKQLAPDFRVYYARVPTNDGGYTMDHTASIFLFDSSGRFSGTISYGEAAEMRQAKLRKLLLS